MPGSPVVFFILAAVAVGTALGMILSRNAVYSALFLALNFSAVAMLYLILGAPFIALSQITVYAGSIMVLFLFVIMLLGAENLPSTDKLRWQPLLAIPLVVILAVDFAINLFRSSGDLANVASVPENFGAPVHIGEMLFKQFALPFEVTGVILLTAILGAIMLAKPDKASRGRTGAKGSADRPSHSTPRNVNGVTGLEITDPVASDQPQLAESSASERPVPPELVVPQEQQEPENPGPGR